MWAPGGTINHGQLGEGRSSNDLSNSRASQSARAQCDAFGRQRLPDWIWGDRASVKSGEGECKPASSSATTTVATLCPPAHPFLVVCVHPAPPTPYRAPGRAPTKHGMMASKQVSDSVIVRTEPGTHAECGRSCAAPAGQAATGTCPTSSARSTEGEPVCSSSERSSRRGTRPSSRTSSASSSMISSSGGRAFRSECMFFSSLRVGLLCPRRWRCECVSCDVIRRQLLS